jgi:hypothetical protein
MTYVPNMIGILTHGVDLWHHRLRIGREIPNDQWSSRKVKRGGRKRKRARVLLADQSHRMN